MLRWPHMRVVVRACTANGPELKSLASGRFRLGTRRVSEVGHVHFSSAARNSGDNDASLIHVAALEGIMHVGAGGISLPIKGRRVTPRL